MKIDEQIRQLQELASLRDANALSADEYEKMKTAVLSGEAHDRVAASGSQPPPYPAVEKPSSAPLSQPDRVPLLYSIGLASAVASLFFGSLVGAIAWVTTLVGVVGLASERSRRGRWMAWAAFAAGVVFSLMNAHQYGHLDFLAESQSSTNTIRQHQEYTPPGPAPEFDFTRSEVVSAWHRYVPSDVHTFSAPQVRWATGPYTHRFGADGKEWLTFFWGESGENVASIGLGAQGLSDERLSHFIERVGVLCRVVHSIGSTEDACLDTLLPALGVGISTEHPGWRKTESRTAIQAEVCWALDVHRDLVTMRVAPCPASD